MRTAREELYRAVHPSAASPSRRKAIGSRSPIIMARRSGFPMPPRRRNPRLEGRASRRDILAGRALPCHLDAGKRAARLAARRQARHAHDRLSGEDAFLLLVAATAIGSRHPAPRPVSFGRSKTRTGRWASRRVNAACGQAKVSRVAFHPKALVVAIGYEDGWILLCRLTDGAEILVRRTEAGTQDPVTGARLGRGRTPSPLRHRRRREPASRNAGLIASAGMPYNHSGAYSRWRARMIISRFALFFAFVFGLASTQAARILAAISSSGSAAPSTNSPRSSNQFDTDATAQHLTPGAASPGSNPTPIRWPRARREMQQPRSTGWRSCAMPPPPSTIRISVRQMGCARRRLSIRSIAARAYEAYQPAVPTTPDGFISGLIGFVIGGDTGAPYRSADPPSQEALSPPQCADVVEA